MSKISTSILAVAVISTFGFTIPAVKSTVYTVDKNSTKTTWVGKKVTGQHTGNISFSKGTITAEGKNITAGNFEIDMNSITCTDLTDNEYNAKLINHLHADDFFSVAKYPTAQFVLTKAVFKSGNDYDMTGNLTIKGITNEVTFPAIVKMDEKVIVTIAKIMVNRTKFDMKFNSASFFASIGDKAINDEFELDVNVVANSK